MRHRISTFLSLCAASLLCACAMLYPETTPTKFLLVKAGFHKVKPATPEQQGVFAQMPDKALECGLINGTQTYSYKDQREGVAYVGGDTEYKEYSRLLTEWNLTHAKAPGQKPNQRATMPGMTPFGGDNFWLKGQ
jgi:hypothetical protein